MEKKKSTHGFQEFFGHPNLIFNSHLLIPFTKSFMKLSTILNIYQIANKHLEIHCLSFPSFTHFELAPPFFDLFPFMAAQALSYVLQVSAFQS